jgi:hypothetical protein
MFQLFHTHVALFYLDVAYVAVAIYIYMLQAYVPNILSVSDICCSKFFMLQVFHEQAMETNADGGGPMAAGGPHVHTYTNCLILLCNSIMACDGQICL